ncbi:hypothetical protein ACFT5B_14210 [Luteimicrobium sp. NPDC057192]|uniref:hypothetical protein n=1 Tax=Luteimicrobium sp. NPDC057192 TaxID=3346042 RepID=UPI0036428583
MTETQPVLFDLSVGASGGVIRQAAQRAIAAREVAGVLGDADALTVQLILETAAAVDRGLAWAKVSVATTTLVRELHELLDALPAIPGGEVPAGALDDPAFAAFREALA